MKGNAYVTYKQMPEEEKGDFEQIKKNFKRVFGTSRPMAWSQLKELHLLPGESVDVLVDKIEEKLRVISGDKEVPEEIVTFFLSEALPVDMRKEIMVQHGEEMKKACLLHTSPSPRDS